MGVGGFKKGAEWKGNAKGRPRKGECITDVLRKYVEKKRLFKAGKGKRTMIQIKEQLAKELVDLALDGNLKAITEVLDRLEGRPTQKVDQTVTQIEPSPIAQAIQDLRDDMLKADDAGKKEKVEDSKK